MKSKADVNSGGDAELAQGLASVPPSPDAGEPPDGAVSMSPLQWFSIAAVLVGACLAEYVVGFAWFFSPGWANDPLLGPNFHAVLAAAMTAWVSLLLMTAAAAAGALVGSSSPAGSRREVWPPGLWGVAVVRSSRDPVLEYLDLLEFLCPGLAGVPGRLSCGKSSYSGSEVNFRGF